MAIRPIVEVPDPRLREISKPVEGVDDELRKLVADMFETMYDAPGIGLAAIQVGVPKRVLVIDLQEPEEEGGEPVRDPRVFINPGDPRRPRTRTCPTPRAACRCPTNMPRSTVRTASARAGWSSTGKVREEEIEGLLAVCLQHEMDHLEGISVHRSSVAPEAQHDPQQAEQAAKRRREKSGLAASVHTGSKTASAACRQSAAHSRQICAHSLQCS